METPKENHLVKERMTFIHSIVQLLEDMDKWKEDEKVTKMDMAKDVRTELLRILQMGTVYPYMSYFSIEPSTVRAEEEEEAK